MEAREDRHYPRSSSVAAAHVRRAVATHLVEAGVLVRAVQAFLSHHDLASTELYLEVRRARLRQAVKLLERHERDRPNG